jgi:hypothetical protein
MPPPRFPTPDRVGGDFFVDAGSWRTRAAKPPTIIVHHRISIDPSPRNGLVVEFPLPGRLDMQFRFLVCLVLLSSAFAVPLAAQETEERPQRPVTKREIRVSLALSPETEEGIEDTNKELISKIKERGVDFALSREEEWSLQLQDASEELIRAIRDALPAEAREQLLKKTEQNELYSAFSRNYTRTDPNSRLIAVAAGKEFLRRYRNDTDVSDKVAFLQRTIPGLERSIPRMVTPVVRGRRRN